MKLHFYSYRYAEEILQHPSNVTAWNEIKKILVKAPLFIYPNKSAKKKNLDIVQQLMNTYFDRQFAVEMSWDFHPLATGIRKSGLKADFRKKFDKITVQAEIQFGNMARWYSDIFKFQTAYSQGLIQCGLSVVPMATMAKRIDSNIAQFERALRELPSADLSITLPILLVGLEPDKRTPIVDVRACKFASVKEITGVGKAKNRWRIVNAYLSGVPMSSVGPESDTGNLPATEAELDEAEDAEEGD